MQNLFNLGITIAISVAIAICEGFVLTKLWAWFIVPTFSLPMITIPVAIGICLVSSLLTHQRSFNISSGDEMKDMMETFKYSFSMAVTILIIGWVTTFFI